MNYSDIINGLFGLFGSFFIISNIYKILKDKKVQGVYILPAIYFALWGLYHLYFYPQNGLIFSFLGGIAIFIADVVWIILAWYYNGKNKVTA